MGEQWRAVAGYVIERLLEDLFHHVGFDPVCVSAERRRRDPGASRTRRREPKGLTVEMAMINQVPPDHTQRFAPRRRLTDWRCAPVVKSPIAA